MDAARRLWVRRCERLSAGVAILLTLMTLYASSPASAASVAFSANVRVNNGPSPYAYQVEPYIVVDPQSRLFVGWKESETATGSGARVSFSRSLDAGASWSPTFLMPQTASSLRQSDPWLALDGQGRLYFSYIEFPANRPYPEPVVVSRSDDGGASWPSVVNVDDQRRDFTDKDAMASDGNGTLYVAYSSVNKTASCECIVLTRSSDAGVTWSHNVQVSDSGGNNLGAVIAARSDGRVTVVWSDAVAGNVMADTSTDFGRTWGTDVRVNDINGSAPFIPTSPVLTLPTIAATSGGALFAAWADHRFGDWDILVARSLDGGRTWSPPVRVNDDLSGRDQWQPALAVDGQDNLHLAWMDNRTGNLNVFYSTSQTGARWSSNVKVTDAETSSAFTRPGDYLGLAVDSHGTVFVVWTDGRNGDLDIYFARSISGGTKTTTVSSAAMASDWPRSKAAS